jgi:hypothetical protein
MQAALRALVLCRDRELALKAADALAPVGVYGLVVVSEHTCLERLRYEPWDMCVIDDVRMRRRLKRRLGEEGIDVPIVSVPPHDDAKSFAGDLGARAVAFGSREQMRPRGVPIVVADLTVVPAELDAWTGGQPLHLRRREFQILYLLAWAQGRPITVSEFGRRLDLPEPTRARKVVTTQIVRLRAKLRQASSRSVISNERSKGWALATRPP